MNTTRRLHVVRAGAAALVCGAVLAAPGAAMAAGVVSASSSEVSPTNVANNTAAQSPAGQTAASEQGKALGEVENANLARTGFDASGVAAGGAIAVGAGALLLVGARRRRHASDSV